MQANHSDTFVVVGRISRPHGVRGWNHLTSYTDPQENLFNYKPLALAADSAEQKSWEICENLEFRQTIRGLFICIDGSDNRDNASRYVNQLVGTHRSCLPEPADDEHYWVDMIGTDVFDSSGQRLGVVDHLSSNGAHEVIHIQTDKKEICVPFVSNYVEKIIPGESLVLHWEREWE